MSKRTRLVLVVILLLGLHGANIAAANETDEAPETHPTDSPSLELPRDDLFVNLSAPAFLEILRRADPAAEDHASGDAPTSADDDAIPHHKTDSEHNNHNGAIDAADHAAEDKAAGQQQGSRRSDRQAGSDGQGGGEGGGGNDPNGWRHPLVAKAVEAIRLRDARRQREQALADATRPESLLRRWSKHYRKSEAHPIARFFAARDSDGALLHRRGVLASTVVIVLPGGGYGKLSHNFEGDQICRNHLTKLGMACLVLSYRVPPAKATDPYDDIAKAVTLLKSGAFSERLSLVGPEHTDAQRKHHGLRIGIVGFSAGGHAAATYLASSPIRLDFAALCYPVISMRPSITHRGSYMRLLGAASLGNASETKTRQYSIDETANADNFPSNTFIWHTLADTIVPWEHSRRMFRRLNADAWEAQRQQRASGAGKGNGGGGDGGDPKANAETAMDYFASKWKARAERLKKEGGTADSEAFDGAETLGNRLVLFDMGEHASWAYGHAPQLLWMKALTQWMRDKGIVA